MLSLSYITPYIFLYQRQPPHIIDAQPPRFPKCKTQSGKTQSCSSTSISHTINFSISTELSVSTKSDSLFANRDDTENLLLHEIDPINQLISSSRVGNWLQSCSNVHEIKKLHAVIIKSMKDPVAYVNNNLVSVYVNFGDLVAARRVFDNMSERNVVSWTAMLNGYQRHGLGREALRLFIEFVNCGIHGNAQTYVCMLNLCSRTFDYELGRQLHACIIKKQVSNSILDCTVLHFYAQFGDLSSAFEVFDRMQKRDLISWTTMITACSQHRRGQEAFVMLSQMLSKGLDPNEFTLCSVLNACAEEKELRFGKQLHGTVVKKGYNMDVYVGTALVDLYAKCGEIEDSRAIFDGMNRRNAITWNSIIAGYAGNNLGEEAIRLFRMMTRLKVYANNSTMVSILRACGLLRALSTGKEVHAQIFKNFEPSNIFVGSALVWLYCKCREYASASKVLENLPDKDVVSWTAMISGCAHLGHEYEALEYLKEMLGEGVEPNPFTYSSALKACARLENIKQGKLIHSSINKTPALSNVFVGSALVHMYSKCGHLSEAIQVFDSMPERNLVSWKSMIVAYARNGLCGEALKLMYRMQAEGIEVDDYILSTVLTACGEFKHLMKEVHAQAQDIRSENEDDPSDSGAIDELALIVRKMKESMSLKDRFHKMRRFTDCFLGSEAVDFLSEDQYLERDDAVEFGRKLANELFFRHVAHENIFEDGNHLYRFLDDDPLICQCKNIPRGISEVKPKPITEISSRLRFLFSAILEAYTSEDGKFVDYGSIHGSEEFARYLRIAEDLQRVQLNEMAREEKLSFFINLYNMMAIHAILVFGHPSGALERRKFFGDFKYVIGGSAYSLSAIYNGILRGNQRPPYNLTKPFGAKDRWLKVALPYPEPLVHFTLVCGTRSGPALRCYSPRNIDKELTDAACDFLRNGGLYVDLTANIAYASKILKWYSVHFGKNEVEVLKHAANYLEPADCQALLDSLSNTQLKVIYQSYDWGLNN